MGTTMKSSATLAILIVLLAMAVAGAIGAGSRSLWDLQSVVKFIELLLLLFSARGLPAAVQNDIVLAQMHPRQ